MKFSELVSMAAALLRTRGRMTYRALQLEYGLDAATLEFLRDELLFAHPEVSEVDGRGLRWSESGPGATAVPLPVAPPPPDTVRADEYRQLTVMFCDLVGSTALVSKLDPETWQALLAEYHAVCQRAVAHFEGHVAQFLGDGVLAYFGYPNAHEDDAVRAVQAAREILAEMAAGVRGDIRRLHVRIGLHTGAVMVTGVGAGTRRETLAVGEAPHVAARLQAEAAPDAIVVSAVTARLLSGRFDMESRGTRELAGVQTPLEVFEIRGADTPRSAFDAAVALGLTPAIGRDPELGLLLDRAGRARQGKGQVVLVIGEPGIGKSRLAREAREKGNLRVLEYRCSAHCQHSALYPLVQFLSSALGFTLDEPPFARLTRVAALVESAPMNDDSALPLLAALLSIPESAGYVLPPMSAAMQRQRTFALLIDTMLREAAREPLCLLFEDLHWADPTTLEFLGQLIDQVATAPLFILATARPEFVSPWPPRAHLSPLMIGRLSPSEVMSMISKVARGRSLPADVVHQILVKTDGVPLFVEELTKALLESGQLRETAGAYLLDGSLPAIRIPDTLQESLQARLDRLQGAREIAQFGAVVGREFSHALLVSMSRLDEASLAQGLRELLDAELLYRRGPTAEAGYVFKHALVQDAAYRSLPRRRRQELHARVATYLQTDSPELADTQPELVAHHLAEAGQHGESVSFWLKAGQRALERSANLEAIAHLRRGLAALSPTDGDSATMRLELALLMALAPALMSTRGYAHADVRAANARVREIAHVVEDSSERFRLLYGLWLYYANIPDYPTVLDLTSRMLEEAEGLQGPEPTMLSDLARGVTSGWMGCFPEARRQLQSAASLYDHERHARLTYYCGLNPHTFASVHQGIACWHLGFADAARDLIENAVARAESIGHPNSLAHALVCKGWIDYLCGYEASAADFATRARVIAVTNEATFWVGWSDVILGVVIKDRTLIAQGIQELESTGGHLAWTQHMLMQAEVDRHCGELSAASASLTDAIAASAAGEEIVLAELHRVRGEIRLDLEGDTEGALADFDGAIAIARRQHAMGWELRAALSRARLLHSLARDDEAHSHLSEVYARFTEGFDTRDLRDAQALIIELSRARA